MSCNMRCLCSFCSLVVIKRLTAHSWKTSKQKTFYLPAEYYWEPGWYSYGFWCGATSHRKLPPRIWKRIWMLEELWTKKGYAFSFEVNLFEPQTVESWCRNYQVYYLYILWNALGWMTGEFTPVLQWYKSFCAEPLALLQQMSWS